MLLNSLLHNKGSAQQNKHSFDSFDTIEVTYYPPTCFTVHSLLLSNFNWMSTCSIVDKLDKPEFFK